MEILASTALAVSCCALALSSWSAWTCLTVSKQALHPETSRRIEAVEQNHRDLRVEWIGTQEQMESILQATEQRRKRITAAASRLATQEGEAAEEVEPTREDELAAIRERARGRRR